MRKQGGTDPMIRLEIKKSIKSRYFLIAVALLYIMFMLGDSGQVLGSIEGPSCPRPGVFGGHGRQFGTNFMEIGPKGLVHPI